MIKCLVNDKYEIYIDKRDLDEVLKLDYQCYKEKKKVEFYYRDFSLYVDKLATHTRDFSRELVATYVKK